MGPGAAPAASARRVADKEGSEGRSPERRRVGARTKAVVCAPTAAVRFPGLGGYRATGHAGGGVRRSQDTRAAHRVQRLVGAGLVAGGWRSHLCGLWVLTWAANGACDSL